LAENRIRLPQLLSALAVVLSLLFVGYEIRLNTAAQRGGARQGLADASREFTLALSTNPEARRVWYTMFHPHLYEGREAPPLTYADTVHARVLMFTNLRNLENVFLQHIEGVIDESVLDTYAFRARQYEAPFFPQLWGELRSQFDPRFADRFEEENGL
jgi:hypothetical protein